MMMNRERKWLLFLLSAAAMVCGGFCIGAGMSILFGNFTGESMEQVSYEGGKHGYKAPPKERELDKINQDLAESMEFVTIERELYAHEKEFYAEARIAVDKKSKYGCIVSIIRDATGDVIYRSGLIEPGCYIEKIPFENNLKRGYYPCTAIWSFYTKEDEYLGEAAWKVTVIIW